MSYHRLSGYIQGQNTTFESRLRKTKSSEAKTSQEREKLKLELQASEDLKNVNQKLEKEVVQLKHENHDKDIALTKLQVELDTLQNVFSQLKAESNEFA